MLSRPTDNLIAYNTLFFSPSLRNSIVFEGSMLEM